MVITVYQSYQNTVLVTNITFIFDRCHRSWAAVTAVKYEYDSMDIRNTVAKAKISLTEISMNAVSVTPTSVSRGYKNHNTVHSILLHVHFSFRLYQLQFYWIHGLHVYFVYTITIKSRHDIHIYVIYMYIYTCMYIYIYIYIYISLMCDISGLVYWTYTLNLKPYFQYLYFVSYV